MSRTRRSWTLQEDARLRDLVQSELDNSHPLLWRELAKHMPGRSNKDCRKRWWNSLAGGTAKGVWSAEEDRKLVEAVDKFGTNWSRVASVLKTRSGEQCSSHWRQVLDPSINFSDWTAEEDEQLLEAVRICGTNWSTIASFHKPERTTLALKNRYWKLRSQQSDQQPGSDIRPVVNGSNNNTAPQHHQLAGPSATQQANDTLSSKTTAPLDDETDDDDADDDDDEDEDENDGSEAVGVSGNLDDVDMDMSMDMVDWTGLDGQHWTTTTTTSTTAKALDQQQQSATWPSTFQAKMAPAPTPNTGAAAPTTALMPIPITIPIPPPVGTGTQHPRPSTGYETPTSASASWPGGLVDPALTDAPLEESPNTPQTSLHHVCLTTACTTNQLSHIMSMLASTGLNVKIKIDTE